MSPAKYILLATCLLTCSSALRMKKWKNDEEQDPFEYENNQLNSGNPALDGWNSIDGRLAGARDPIKVFVQQTQACSDKNNIVPPGVKYTNHLPPHPSGTHRRYSVIPHTSRNEQANCATVDALMIAVKHGERVWEDGTAEKNHTWTEPSYFVPHGCNIPYHNPTEAKEVLNKVAAMQIDGDSLTRHMTLGLTLLLTGNHYDGALALADANPNCVCDGQFSESLQCREHVDLSAVTQSLPDKTCEEDDHSPRIFWLQGGPHFHSDADKTLKKYFLPMITGIRKKYAKCKISPTFLISGLNAQSRILDKKFPRQTREKAEKFNDVISKEFAGKQNIHFVDFFNMTKDANSCEGFHYLTDVNLDKANTFLALVDLITQKPVPEPAVNFFTNHMGAN